MKFFRGFMYAMPISLVLWAGIFSVVGCVHKQPEYVICNTDNCGDNVTVEVEPK